MANSYVIFIKHNDLFCDFYKIQIKIALCKEKYLLNFIMQKQEPIEVEGIIIESLPNANFKVQLENGFTILAHISGRIRRNSIKILLGDRVTVELSPYDLKRGRITYRHKRQF